MCLILFAWQPESRHPLIVAANRDEFYQRSTQRLHAWDDAFGTIAGRDLTAGGTWLGVNRQGRFSALTNIRDPKRIEGDISRGELVRGFLQSDVSANDYLAALAAEADRYAGFNLLAGDGRELYFLNSTEREVQKLCPGVYGLSNATLNTPWPKLVRARNALEKAISPLKQDALLDLLHDPWRPEDVDLPSTGVSLELEQLLSSAFVESDYYGTRASTVLITEACGAYQMVEQSFGPHGLKLAETHLEGRFNPALSLQD